MVWSYDMDLTMLKELAGEGVFRVKPNTREKGLPGPESSTI